MCLVNPVRGIDEVRTSCTQEGFSILEQETFVLRHEALEFLAFRRRQTSFVVLIGSQSSRSWLSASSRCNSTAIVVSRIELGIDSSFCTHFPDYTEGKEVCQT
jgi:hypothetical protein